MNRFKAGDKVVRNMGFYSEEWTLGEHHLPGTLRIGTVIETTGNTHEVRWGFWRFSHGSEAILPLPPC